MKYLILSNLKRNASFYIYGLFITSIFGFFYVSTWLDSFDEPVGIVVDFSGNIPKKIDQAKEKRLGSRFWDHQLQLIERTIDAPERLVRERNELVELVEKNLELGKSLSVAFDKTFSEKYPEMGKIRVLEKLKQQQEFEMDQALSQARWELMYEQNVRQRTEYLKLKEIVTQKLNKAKEVELSAGRRNCVECK